MQITIILISTLVLASIVLILLNKDQFGARISKDKLRPSMQYNVVKKRFQNEGSYIVKLAPEHDGQLKNALWRYIFGKNQKPACALPEIKPDLIEFLQKATELKFIWFGHSSFMVNFAGKILLFDPVFANSASPFSFITKRFQKPVLALEELPEVDYIVLSHDHYDHLDMQTIKFFKNRATKFLAPIGVGLHLQHWGIEENRVTELDWWQGIKIGDLEFILTPAQHFSGRRLVDYKHTLWGSWVVRNNQQSIYFSGDSGYAKHFKEIGDKYGPFDLVFIENGQYDQSWRDVHMLPVDVIQAVIDLRAKAFVPIHWGMFCLAPHQWFDPVQTISTLAQERNIALCTPKIGQIVTLGLTKTQAWWRHISTIKAPTYSLSLHKSS